MTEMVPAPATAVGEEPHEGEQHYFAPAPPHSKIVPTKAAIFKMICSFENANWKLLAALDANAVQIRTGQLIEYLLAR